jgi:hypothetical protein
MEEAFPHVHSDQLHALLYGLCIYEQAPNPDRFAMNEIIDDVFFVTCFFFFFFFVVLGFELSASHLLGGCSAPSVLPALFYIGYFAERVSQTICLNFDLPALGCDVLLNILLVRCRLIVA